MAKREKERSNKKDRESDDDASSSSSSSSEFSLPLSFNNGEAEDILAALNAIGFDFSQVALRYTHII
jgi:hypothetical protein